jgi:hypothetical protein
LKSRLSIKVHHCGGIVSFQVNPSRTEESVTQENYFMHNYAVKSVETYQNMLFIDSASIRESDHGE